MKKKPVRHEHTWVDEFSIGARQLSYFLSRILAKGNVRELVILRPDGRVLFKTSLTNGVAVAGVFTILAPVLTALGAMAALLTEIRVRIVYTGNPRKD